MNSKKISNNFFIILIFFVHSILLFSSQDSDTLRTYHIFDIILNGNEITDDDIILREMKIQKGDYVTDEEIEYDRDRISSLGIFTFVNIEKIIVDTSYILSVNIKESWYIWPLPILDRRDKDWSKISYGAVLRIQNFRGRNQTLEIAGALGYDPYGKFVYDIPNLIGKEDIKLSFSIAYQKRENKSLRSRINGQNYSEDILETQMSIGKRFGYFQSLNFNLGYSYLKVPIYYPGRTISTTGIDTRISLGLSYAYDTRDFNLYPSKGSMVFLLYSKKGLGESLVDYSVFNYDLRQNFSIGKFIFAFRNYYYTSFWGEIPNYANCFIGYGERIRGKFFDAYEGQSMTMGNVEVRFPFVKDWLIEFNFPIIPKRMQAFNVLIDFHLFSDFGLIWNNYERLIDKKLLKGFGFGTTIAVIPYNSMRFEVGFDEEFKSQFIIDISAAF